MANRIADQAPLRPAPQEDGSQLGAPAPELAPEDSAGDSTATPYGVDEFSSDSAPEARRDDPHRHPGGRERPAKRLLFRNGISSYALLGALGNMGRAVRGIVSRVSEAVQRVREHAASLEQKMRQLLQLKEEPPATPSDDGPPVAERLSADELFTGRR